MTVPGAPEVVRVPIGPLLVPVPTTWSVRSSDDAGQALAVEGPVEGALSIFGSVVTEEERRVAEATITPSEREELGGRELDVQVAMHLRGYQEALTDATVLDAAEVQVAGEDAARLLVVHRAGVSTLVLDVVLVVGSLGGVRIQVAGPGYRRAEVEAVADAVVAASAWREGADAATNT